MAYAILYFTLLLAEGNFESCRVDRWKKSFRVNIQMKATEQNFPVVLFITLYKVILSFESVDEILKCDHSNESY